MSDIAAQEVIKRAIKEDSFRASLAKDFDDATKPYDLTADEREALRSIDWSKPLPAGTGVMGTWVHIYKSMA